MSIVSANILNDIGIHKMMNIDTSLVSFFLFLPLLSLLYFIFTHYILDRHFTSYANLR